MPDYTIFNINQYFNVLQNLLYFEGTATPLSIRSIEIICFPYSMSGSNAAASKARRDATISSLAILLNYLLSLLIIMSRNMPEIGR